jgi:transcriptional regulator with XRE-family HTH domain
MPGKRQITEKSREIGARIAAARHEAGAMGQQELGDLVGVTVRSVQAWEAGEVIPYRYLRDLESALGRPAAWILHGEEAVVGHVEATREILERLDGLQSSVDALREAPREAPTEVGGRAIHHECARCRLAHSSLRR